MTQKQSVIAVWKSRLDATFTNENIKTDKPRTHSTVLQTTHLASNGCALIYDITTLTPFPSFPALAFSLVSWVGGYCFVLLNFSLVLVLVLLGLYL